MKSIVKLESFTCLKIIITNLLLVFTILSCSDDIQVNLAPNSFRVSLTKITENSVDVFWGEAFDPDGDLVNYSVVLNGQEIATDLSDRFYYLTDLLPGAEYNGVIIATDSQRNTTESQFEFKTTKVPELKTLEISNLTMFSVVVGGKLIDKGNSEIQEIGLVIGAKLPTVENNLIKVKLELGNNSEFDFVNENEFYFTLKDVPAGTRLFVRAYGINNDGLGYGNSVEFKTFDQNILNSNVRLDSQEEIENFAVSNYTTVNGNVYITGEVYDLSLLEGLAIVKGEFRIGDTSNLESLLGLENLKYIGQHLLIMGNDKLLNISHLNNINFIERRIIVQSNRVLQNINGFENITSLEGVQISFNESITDLNGLNNLEYCEDVILISQNENLKNIFTFQKVKQVDFLTIENNNSLTDLRGFDSLTTINGSFNLSYNDKLVSLTGIEKLTSIQRLVIGGNNSLLNIEGLKEFKWSIGSNSGISIGGNPNLNSLKGFEKLEHIDGWLNIGGNILLSDFCPLKSLFNNGIYNGVEIYENLDNPSIIDIINNCQ